MFVTDIVEEERECPSFFFMFAVLQIFASFSAILDS